MAHRTLQFGGYCSRKGYQQLDQTLALLCELGNAALQERRDAWKLQRKSISFYDQCKSLTEVRHDDPDGVGTVAVAVARGALQRVQRALEAFFRRVKAGAKPGFPRYRSRRRYKTLEVNDVGAGQVRHDGRHAVLRIKGLPAIRLQLKSRPLPEQKPRTIRVTRRVRGCTVDLVYDHEPTALETNEKNVGIDAGRRKRLTLSTGETFAPEDEDWRAIRRAQRKIARSKRRSRRRQKRIDQLARLRRRAAARRRNTCHRITSELIRRFGTLVVEDLKIANMTGSARGTIEEPGRNVAAKAALNRGILQQAWGLILAQLGYKAAWAGRQLLRVDPRYTSQDCSACGRRREKPDSRERWRCTHCNSEHDRDVNAAINLLIRAGILALGSPSSGRTAA